MGVGKSPEAGRRVLQQLREEKIGLELSKVLEGRE